MVPAFEHDCQNAYNGPETRKESALLHDGRSEYQGAEIPPCKVCFRFHIREVEENIALFS